jgi:hypothetical protein
MKAILIGGLLLCLTIPTIQATGQERARDDRSSLQGSDNSKAGSNDNPIEVKTDRFSNVTTVNLKPQAILDKPDHLITMEIKTKLEQKRADDIFRDSVDAYVYFESHSGGGVDFGDGEIHLLVDGRPLRIPPSEIELKPLIKPKPGFRTYKSGLTIFDREALEQIKKANQIEMRLGSIDLTLSTAMLATLREYAARSLAQQKTVNGR